MNYQEMKKDVLETFGHVLGFGRNCMDRHDEGFYQTGMFSSITSVNLKSEWFTKLPMTNEASIHTPIVICDDIKQVCVVRRDILNPEFDVEIANDRTEFSKYEYMDEERWHAVKYAMKQMMLNSFGVKYEGPFKSAVSFHNDVMSVEVDSICKAIEKSILEGKGHVIIPIPFEQYGIYMVNVFTEKHYRCIKANDGMSLYVIINEQAEEKYMAAPKPFKMNDNYTR